MVLMGGIGRRDAHKTGMCVCENICALIKLHMHAWSVGPSELVTHTMQCVSISVANLALIVNFKHDKRIL